MRLEIAYISPRRQRLKSAPARALLEEYVQRASRYMPTEAVPYASEEEFLAALARNAGRLPPTLILLDSRGDALTSEALAARLDRLREGGAQHAVFAIGPADGWTERAWKQAHQRLSLGAITLPHELALVVLSEQLYRGLTILAGHPYHGGHA